MKDWGGQESEYLILPNVETSRWRLKASRGLWQSFLGIWSIVIPGLWIGTAGDVYGRACSRLLRDLTAFGATQTVAYRIPHHQAFCSFF
jgi:hypothetical protein